MAQGITMMGVLNINYNSRQSGNALSNNIEFPRHGWVIPTGIALGQPL